VACIAILSSVHPAFDTRIFQKEARSLVAGGHEVTLIIPHERDEVVDGVSLRAIRQSNHRVARMVLGPLRVLQEALRTRAEVYHFHDPELLPVGLVLKLLGKRVIYDVHEDVPKDIRGKTYLPRWLVGPLAVTANAIEKTISRAFDLVILARDDIQESFAGHPRTLLVRNYPILDDFPRPSGGAHTNGCFTVTYTGGLVADRGVAEMIDALDRVARQRAIRMILFGKFWPESFEARIRSMPGFRQVDFRGWIRYEALPAELARADVGIVCFLPEPNNINAGPTKLFEYMACGLPVVASNFPMWREVIEGSDCGLCVDPTDPEAIASALRFLADHPERRAAMAANGRRAVEERYNWELEAKALMQAYARLTAR